jgi:WD40 repeat protein
MTAPKVFLSHTSTMARLPEGRSFVQAALDALAEAELLQRDMRFFAADDRTPAQVCVDAVRNCDVYVGILGLDYGSPVRDRPEVSYTELEFETALERRRTHGMRVFAFLLDDKAADEGWGPVEPRQEAFRRRVLDSGLTAAFFATPGDLQHLVYRTLHQPTSRPGRPLQHRDRRAINFLDRERDLGELTAEVGAAVADGTSLSFVGLKGMGGIGKTALAAELAERLAREFPGGVLWVNLQEESPAEAARRWLRDLRHDERDLDPDECLRRFRQLAGDLRPLIVLDNVPRPGKDGNLAEPLLVKAPGVATLLTTRFREAVPAGVRVQPLDVLPPDEARALLRSHIGQDAENDPAAADVVELCERLPLFINVVGAAVARGYYTLADYAEELRGRGLAALAEEDDIGRAGVIFDLSWDHLSVQAKELFAVLALAPGEDVGPNLVRAWLEQGAAGGGGPRPERLLAELGNASLLTPVAGPAGRYRYHDRVRDYALTKLPLPEGEARRRLLLCWTDWGMVKAEFEAAGADWLARQFLRLRSWGVDEAADFGPWFHFARGQASVLGLYPELFFQQAFNEAEDSPVSRSARGRVGTAEEPGRWLGWENRPREWVPPACLMVLRGHPNAVFSVAVCADGRAAVSGSDDRTLRVWDLSGGRCTAVLEGHAGSVLSVAVTPDGRTAVSGSSDKTLRVWDLAGGRCSAVLEGHTDWVRSVAVSADGRVVVSGPQDGTVRVWDLSGGRCTAVLEGHTDSVLSVAVTGNGRTAVSGSSDRTLRVWDLSGGRCSTAVLEGHAGSVWSVAVTGDGRTVVSGSADRTVRVWDLVGGRCSAVLEGHEDSIRSVAVAVDGQAAVSGSYDCTVRVWDLAVGRCTALLEGHGDSVASVSVSGDGRTAISDSEDHTVRVWDLASNRCTASHAAGSEEARRAWATVDSSLTSTVAIEPYGLTLRDPTSGTILARFPGSFSSSACSADGRHVVAGDGRGGVYLLTLHTRPGVEGQ